MVVSATQDKASTVQSRHQLIDLLCACARQAGLSAGEIAKDFEAALNKAADTQAAEVSQEDPQPKRIIPHSKSHVHRVLTGRAPIQSWPWIRQFLHITAKASGLSKEQFQSLCAQAHALRQASLADPPVQPSLAESGSAPAKAKQDLTVAVLRLEVDLERARHTETRLRFLIRDAQMLTMTLWAVIGSLRDIVASHDLLLTQDRRKRVEEHEGARWSEVSQQALDYTRTAQREADRAVARIRTLEMLWDQARAEVRRLAQHPDAASFVLGAPDGETTPALVPQDFVAQPALDDIAEALAKAHAVNEREDEDAQEISLSLSGSGSLGPDEASVLLAAVRLPDPALRMSAAAALWSGWAEHPDTRDVLVRLAREDRDEDVRVEAMRGLARACPGDREGRDIVISYVQGRTRRSYEAGVELLAEGWSGDAAARDVLVDLTSEPNAHVARILGALAAGWQHDPRARDHVLSFSGSTRFGTREAVARALGSGWPGDETAFTALTALVYCDDPAARAAAVASIGAGWRDDEARGILVRTTLNRGSRLDATVAAAEALLRGWPGEREISQIFDDLSDELGAVRPLLVTLSACYRDTVEGTDAH
ncbi:hypothetical protein [Streptomyces rubiginosohelvolus]|uniref:hypothetical protein n=1 Tax=Streptomyces rubiginosohelvolus TaxID=67362 RepID=UPI0036467A64